MIKNILIMLTAFVLLVGCTNKNETGNEVDPKMELLVKENTLLQDKLETRPPLSADQLRETMNLSLKTLDAMVNKNYEYLESITDPNVTINKDSNSFQFENGITQKFLQSIDYSKLEYRFHEMKDDIVTVGFAEPPAEYFFEFTLKDDRFLLHSFLSN